MKKKKQCPKCKSEKVMEIAYGLMDPSYKVPDDVWLGGCCVTDNEWHCGDCDWEWGRNCEGSYNKFEE